MNLITEKFKERVCAWKKEICSHKKLIFISICLFILANVINQIAGHYVDKVASAAVSDLILDHLGPMNLSFLFTWGYICVLVTLFAYPLFFKVKELHTVISQFSLLVLIRSFFIILTHLRAPLDAIRGNLPTIYETFAFSNDMFFSGHTSICFIGFLLFRKEKIGKFFLIATFVMAFTVLAMHVHYSIDVFAAFFITYGSYKLGKYIFKGMNGNEKN